MRKENLKVEGHIGTWYIIDETYYKGQKVFLLESEQYGDNAASIIVDSELRIVMEDVYNGFDDLEYI